VCERERESERGREREIKREKSYGMLSLLEARKGRII